MRRARLLLAALRLFAAGRVAVGTRAGTRTTSAGATSWATAACRNATATTTHQGVTDARQNARVTAARTTFAPISSRRPSRLSATAPANGPSTTPGSAWAAAADAVAKDDPVRSYTK